MKEIESENVRVEASAKDSRNSRSRHSHFIARVLPGILGIQPLRHSLEAFARFWNWTLDYDGFFAVLVKPIPVLIMAAIMLYPWYSWAYWMHLGLIVGVPLCYSVLALWLTINGLLGFFGIVAVAVRDYKT